MNNDDTEVASRVMKSRDDDSCRHRKQVHRKDPTKVLHFGVLSLLVIFT